MRIHKKISCALILTAGIFLFCFSALAEDVVVYGDSQIDEVAQRQVVQAIVPHKPAMVFRVGDIVDDGNNPIQWKKFREIAAPLLDSTEYYPALGNHDKNSPLYFETFKNINRANWYSVDKDGIHFIVLDSNQPLKRGSGQYAWLESDLGSLKPATRFILVFFHHPVLSVGSHKADEKELLKNLMPLLARYKVGAIFSGHDHNYQRFFYKGVTFIVTGGGGSLLRDKTRSSPYLKAYQKTYHFCVLSRENNQLVGRVFDVTNKQIDEFKIFPISKK